MCVYSLLSLDRLQSAFSGMPIAPDHPSRSRDKRSKSPNKMRGSSSRLRGYETDEGDRRSSGSGSGMAPEHRIAQSERCEQITFRADQGYGLVSPVRENPGSEDDGDHPPHR